MKSLAVPNKVFRVFISSTFSDLKAERNALQAEVFPKLKDYCAKLGARFQAIDLRWGISQEASQDQKTIQICLGEIERCQLITPRPNFLVLLGDRYGWCPPPPAIPSGEFKQLMQKIEGENKKIISNWYRLDTNARDPEYILQSWKHLTYDEWGKVEKRLAGILLNAAIDSGYDANSSFKYWASATHQEILAGALSSFADSEYVFGFFRNIDIDSIPVDASAKDFIDLDISGESTVVNQEAQSHLHQLKQDLTQKLGDDNIHHYQAAWTENGPTQEHIQKFSLDVYETLKAAISAQLETYGNIDPLTAEIAAHETFLQKNTHYFTGRKSELKLIEDYLHSDTQYPFVLIGESGTGKSALMAAAIRQAKQSHPSKKIVYRFISATPESSNGYMLLTRLSQELSDDDQNTSVDDLKDFSSIVQTFQRKLTRAGPGTPLILFLDALNQLSQNDPASELTWLPKQLPHNVRLVVSTKPGNTQKALSAWLPVEQWLKVVPLPQSEATDLLDTWLKNEAHRRLQPNQYADVIKNTNPLYLRLAYEEARLWHSYDDLPIGQKGEHGLGTTPRRVMEDLINRLSKDEYHGKTLVGKALGYLAAARNGLNEDELIDLLSLDQEVYIDFLMNLFHIPDDLLLLTQEIFSIDAKTAESLLRELIKKEQELRELLNKLWNNDNKLQLPVVLWSRLYHDLKPYLSETLDNGSLLIKFFHEEIRVVADGLSKSIIEKKQNHLNIAQYFSKLSRYSKRRQDEQPWQMYKAESWHELSQLLSNEIIFNILWENKPFDVRNYWSLIEGNSAIRLGASFKPLIEEPKNFSIYTILNLTRLMWELGCLQEHIPLIEYLIHYFDEQKDNFNYQTVVGYWSAIQQMQGKLQNALAGFEVQERVSRQTQNDKGLAAALGNQAVIYQKQGKLDRAKKLLDEQVQLCRKINDLHGLATAFGNLALNLRMQGQLSDALDLHQQEEKIHREIADPNGLCRSLLNQAGVYTNLGDTAKAISLLEQSEKLARQYGNLELLQAVLGNRGKIYIDLDQLDKAMTFCKEQEVICRQMSNQNDLSASLGNQGAIYLKLREYKKAYLLLKETEKISRQLGNLQALSLTLSNLAAILVEQEQFEEALQLFKEMEAICRKQSQIDGLIICLTNQAVTMHKGRLASQTAIYQKLLNALELVKTYGYEGYLNQINEIIIQVLKLKG